eukprot:COSAG01_NODE_53232_length_340_cov_3.182573_1_plen_54_part_10
MAYRLGIRVYDFGSPHCITGVSSRYFLQSPSELPLDPVPSPQQHGKLNMVCARP